MSDRIDGLLDRARHALPALRRAPTHVRRQATLAVADALERHAEAILAANEADLEDASTIGAALKDRLALDPKRWQAVVDGVRSVAELPDPLGEERALGEGAEGIRVFRRRLPLGVIGIVYEARPNVTAECAALTLMSGNAVILRGGKEARRSNAAIGAAIREGLAGSELPADAVGVLAESSREEVRALLEAAGRVDLVIPRGGAGLMEMVDRFAKVPVVRHGQGICHVYVDAAADVDMATAIVLNAKTQRPGVCNALETLLVHPAVLPALAARLAPRLAEAGVELRADAESAPHFPGASPASDADWATEFLALVLAIRTVPTLDAALEHIERYGTHHSAAIVTGDEASAERFLGEVDASCVLWNASTRFNDGGALGFGAEMGISTTRMHAYGPMALRELTAEKLVVRGTGQTRP